MSEYTHTSTTEEQELKLRFEPTAAGLGETTVDVHKDAAPVPAGEIPSGLPEQFEILGTIGRGGMGTVYKARNKYTGRLAAIKVLAAGEDTSWRERFEQEARACCAFSHPNVVAVYDFGVAEGERPAPYLVLEYVAGRTLEQILRERKPLDTDEFLQIFIDVSAGLAAAHTAGVIHRDIKPANIMIVDQPDGTRVCKLLDFGIAKVLDDPAQEQKALTATGTIFGTPLYMSPEQCAGLRADLRSDIYSLGLVMYESLTGEALHASDNALNTIFQRLNAAEPHFGQNPHGIPMWLQMIVLQCLQRQPDARYQTAEELRAALQNKRPPRVMSRHPLTSLPNRTKRIISLVMLVSVCFCLYIVNSVFHKAPSYPPIAEVLGDNSKNMFGNHCNKAQAEHAAGLDEQALTDVNLAIAAGKQEYGSDVRDFMVSAYQLKATCQQALGQPGPAFETLTRAGTISEQLHMSAETGAIKSQMGSLLGPVKPAAAYNFFHESIKAFDDAHMHNAPENMRAYYGVKQSLYQLAKYTECAEWCQQILREFPDGRDSAWVRAAAYSGLADIALARGNNAEAGSNYAKAWNELKTSTSSPIPRVELANSALSFFAKNDPHVAQEIRDWLRATN